MADSEANIESSCAPCPQYPSFSVYLQSDDPGVLSVRPGLHLTVCVWNCGDGLGD